MKGALQQQQQGSTDERLPPPDGPALGGLLRSMGFWGRATSIYMGYKGTQARAALLKALGSTDEQIKQEVSGPRAPAGLQAPPRMQPGGAIGGRECMRGAMRPRGAAHHRPTPPPAAHRRRCGCRSTRRPAGPCTSCA